KEAVDLTIPDHARYDQAQLGLAKPPIWPARTSKRLGDASDYFPRIAEHLYFLRRADDDSAHYAGVTEASWAILQMIHAMTDPKDFVSVSSLFRAFQAITRTVPKAFEAFHLLEGELRKVGRSTDHGLQGTVNPVP